MKQTLTILRSGVRKIRLERSSYVECGGDLSTYAHNHLRNFETELNDIKIWSQKNKAGKIMVRTQAEAVASASRDYSYVEQEKKSFSRQLGWFLKNIEATKPELEEKLKKATVAENKAKDRLNTLEASFSKKQTHLQTEIGIISSQLRNLKEKKKTYEARNIEAVLSRVEKKPGLLLTNKIYRRSANCLRENLKPLNNSTWPG